MFRKILPHFVLMLITMVSGNTMVFGIDNGNGIPTLPGVDVIDLDQTDANVITSKLYFTNYTEIYEIYGESSLVPYPSHDGFGIVNDAGGWFDKKVDNILGATDNIGNWTLDFFVTNNGPHTWSDYHFEFWNADFTTPLDVTSAMIGSSNFRYPDSTNPLFQNSNFDGLSVSWWAPEWQGPGQGQQFNLTLDMIQLPAEFGIRQVATTVPLPAAFWLFGSGLLGMIGIARRKKAA